MFLRILKGLRQKLLFGTNLMQNLKYSKKKFIKQKKLENAKFHILNGNFFKIKKDSKKKNILKSDDDSIHRIDLGKNMFIDNYKIINRQLLFYKKSISKYFVNFFKNIYLGYKRKSNINLNFNLVQFKNFRKNFFKEMKKKIKLNFYLQQFLYVLGNKGNNFRGKAYFLILRNLLFFYFFHNLQKKGPLTFDKKEKPLLTFKLINFLKKGLKLKPTLSLKKKVNFSLFSFFKLKLFNLKKEKREKFTFFFNDKVGFNFKPFFKKLINLNVNKGFSFLSKVKGPFFLKEKVIKKLKVINNYINNNFIILNSKKQERKKKNLNYFFIKRSSFFFNNNSYSGLNFINRNGNILKSYFFNYQIFNEFKLLAKDNLASNLNNKYLKINIKFLKVNNMENSLKVDNLKKRAIKIKVNKLNLSSFFFFNEKKPKLNCFFFFKYFSFFKFDKILSNLKKEKYLKKKKQLSLGFFSLKKKKELKFSLLTFIFIALFFKLSTFKLFSILLTFKNFILIFKYLLFKLEAKLSFANNLNSLKILKKRIKYKKKNLKIDNLKIIKKKKI